MARYLSVVLRGTQGEAVFLTAESWKQLVAVPDAASPYALGWGVDEGGTLRHAGSSTLWYARFVVDPFSGRAYVFVTNSGDLDTTGAVEKAVMGILGDYSFEALPQ
jgi:D-alanyl-D-alanine carboxypeptidase